MNDIRALIIGLVAITSISLAGERTDRWVPPAETDPAIDDWLEPHFVSLDREQSPRGRLLVFFPGSRALPEDYELIVQTAADVGYHAIGLRYPNSFSVNFDLCGFSVNPNCHAEVRLEILSGIDASALPEVDVSPANSIRNRLIKLLQYLDAEAPSEGWGQFLNQGFLRWDRIAVAGHSQGGGHAAFIASLFKVNRVVMFAGGTDLFLGPNGSFAPWLETHVTPVGRYWGFVHLEDSPNAYLGAWEIIGLDLFGTPAVVDSFMAGFRGSHQLVTLLPAGIPGEYHNTVVADDFTPRNASNELVYRPVWKHLLTAPILPGRPGDGNVVSGKVVSGEADR